MGCAYSNINSQLPVSSPKIVPVSSLLPPEKAGSFRVRILETIKKMDPILFEKVLQQYKPKLNEFTQPLDSKKNLMHHIAESNFADGMTLTIDYVLQKDPNKLSNILNSLDAEGNTPAMTCCIYNAPETLEIIIKHELFDSNTKNCENKTALDLAFENSLPCVNLLTVATTTNTKTASKFFLASSVELLSPRPRATSTSAVSGGDRRNSRKPSRFFSIYESRELTSPLTTVMSLTKETSLKLAPNTKLYSILNGLKDTDQNVFIDDEFPHNMFSILGESSLTLFGPGSKEIKWQRPTEFLNTELKKIKVFEAIDLNIVTMSELAGSDLYSALGIMTEFPQRLLNTFTIKEVNKHGAYSVKFLICGIPVEIVLDDHFPCYDEKNLLFSKPVTNELWFLLLEKAFAKLYGSYEEVKNVDISDALELMTGMPSYQHDIKGTEEEDLWDIMQTYDRKNYIYCAGKYKMGEGKGNRIFSVVNLYENDQYKIIKLRDHFQDFLWDGMFSEKSKNWTKELREETGYIKGERSCVYMELQEFVNHFDFLSVCHYHEGWIRNRVDVITGPNTAALFEITLDQEMDLFISVHQKLPRYVTDSPDYDISPVEILLIEKTEEGGVKKLSNLLFVI